VDFHADDLPQGAFLKYAFRPASNSASAHIVANHQQPTGILRRFNNCSAIGDRIGNWFLQQNVKASLKGRFGVAAVERIRRRDDNGFQVVSTENILVGGSRINPEPVGRLVQCRLIDIKDRPHLRSIRVGNRVLKGVPVPPYSYQGKTNS
jgi:hypothetical protein